MLKNSKLGQNDGVLRITDSAFVQAASLCCLHLLFSPIIRVALHARKNTDMRTSTYFIFIFFVESLELYSKFCMWIPAYLGIASEASVECLYSLRMLRLFNCFYSAG